AKHVLLRRLGRKRFQPPYRRVADVDEGVHAPDAGPEEVPGPGDVGASIARALHLALEDEVRLLEGVVVQRDADAGLVFDEQKTMMARAGVLVDEPLEEDALEALAGALSRAGRRNLA